MASFTDYITVEGERMLAKAVAGETISFTKIVVGSGYLPSGTIEKNVNAVVNPKAEIPIQSVSVNATDSVLISAHFSNKELEHGFYFREKAMYMSDGIDEVLAIYGNNGSSAEYIDTAEVCIVDKKIKSVVKLSSQELANINIVDDTYEFAPVLEPDIKTINEFVKTTAAMAMKVGQRVILNRWTSYTYIGYDPTDASCYITGANMLSDTYDEKLEDGSAERGVGASQNALYEVYGIANRCAEGLSEHLRDKSNPHEVSKEDVGLGNVPNVSTNDQQPTYSEATTLETLKSGEKLRVSFGKIMKAISDLKSHIGNKSNPHEVSKEDVGLGNVPNVSTNDQKPTYSEATKLETLKSGEKLSVSFGKIMKAITELIGVKVSIASIDKDLVKIKSHIGMIIHSTTLDTEEKVKAIYGGMSWSKIEGRMLIGANSLYAVNSTGGSATHKITTSEMPSHNHAQQGTFTSEIQSDNHTHSIPELSGTANANYIEFGIATKWAGDWPGSAAINDSATWANTGGDVIRGLSQSTHSHTVTTDASTTSINSGSHTHKVTISGSTTSSGNGTAMNIMNPYKAVYIWERTA